jgi:hypothetical protein
MTEGKLSGGDGASLEEEPKKTVGNLPPEAVTALAEELATQLRHSRRDAAGPAFAGVAQAIEEATLPEGDTRKKVIDQQAVAAAAAQILRPSPMDAWQRAQLAQGITSDIQNASRGPSL